MFKKIMALVLVIALTATVAVGATVAYLTDRDSEANVFTVGDVSIDLSENFAQGAELVPGVKIEKEATITNTGKNDAYVWMTIAVPAELDTIGDASHNAVHWNVPGAFWEGYHENQTYIQSAIDKGYLPVGSAAVDVSKTWNLNMDSFTTEIDNKSYTVYTLLYNSAIKPAEVTNVGLSQVYLDSHVDIDPNGDWYWVEQGTATGLNWNTNDNGNPVVYVSAYAVQAEGFKDVKEAYNAYNAQWGANGAEYATPAAVVSAADSEELATKITEAGTEPVIVELGTGDYTTNLKIAGGSDITIVGNGENTVLSGQIATTASNAGTLTLRNLTIKVDSSIADSTGISQTSKSAIAIWGDQTVICENVTFDMSLADSTAITSWWDTGKGTSIIVRNCTFNCNGQRPIRATGNVTVENCTFNDPYRYAVQLTAKTSTATELDKAIIKFNNNTIVNGPSGKAFVYGIQLEGADYGCNDCVINGVGNTIVDGGTDSAMYYCECGKVQHETIEWHTEVAAVHEG